MVVFLLGDDVDGHGGHRGEGGIETLFEAVVFDPLLLVLGVDQNQHLAFVARGQARVSEDVVRDDDRSPECRVDVAAGSGRTA